LVDTDGRLRREERGREEGKEGGEGTGLHPRDLGREGEVREEVRKERRRLGISLGGREGRLGGGQAAKEETGSHPPS
jgi:hypothetical protein